MRHFRLFAAGVGLAALGFVHVQTAAAFVTFESGQVRPLAKSPDGNRLFVCNTPDNRLEVFDITGGTFSPAASIPVGLEPVAVAARTNTEIWVVNHLSDSVSIVDISDINAPRVTRTLTVGDEPRDIVFGGAAFNLAFITTAHRGQNIPSDPQLTTEGIGRADVWVFDSADLGLAFGGNEKTVITLFGDTPRPLAVSADGTRVYAGVFLSGNETTTISEGLVPNGGGANGLPPPNTNVEGHPRPEVGLIVKYDGAAWRDELNRDWSAKVKFSLPDYDVFAIDATANPPIQVAGTAGRFPHVGTTLFNMAINPADGNLFVSNLEAFNEVRFEGPGIFSPTTVRGHLVESRITIIDPVTETVTPRHLNKHINYADDIFDPAPNATNDKSLAFPLEMVFSSDGSTLYVAALGSSKVGIYNTAELEDDSFVPSASDHIEVSGGGPTGLALDEAASRMFVLTRFDNSISIVSTATGMETAHHALHNPEPANVVAGRPFLYDARLTSARGDQACASCHIFGDFDALAWDLGNPDDEVLNNPQAFTIGPIGDPDFHPMKGPMTTQSLRGMDNHGPMHWRGDRTGGNDEVSSQPDGGFYDEVRAFKKFNGAFFGLIGRSEVLTDPEMASFTDFILDVMYPPNPVRNLDNSLTADQAVGKDIFFNRDPIDTLQTCNGCHVTNRAGNLFTSEHPGFFGTDGRSSFENETQHMKIAHLRNIYQKVGMFGMPAIPFLNPGDNGDKGEQVRGFGFLHDGSIDTPFRFFQATVFNNGATFPGFPVTNDGLHNDTERRQMEAFMFAFDSNHAPVVGQQVTLGTTSGSDAADRLSLMLDRADAGDCDVVAKASIAGEGRGYLYIGSATFISDRTGDGVIDEDELRLLSAAAGQEMTFTAVPVGEGRRIGIDRDADGYVDGDETDAETDPADDSDVACAATTAVVFKKAIVIDDKGRLTLSGDVTLATEYVGGNLAVEVSDQDGFVFADVVPSSGLVANSKGTTFNYRAPRGAIGITRARIKLLSTGDYRVTIKANKAWTPPSANGSPTSTDVTVHVVDECFVGDATKVVH